MKKKYYFILLFIILVTASLYILTGKGGMDPKVVVDAYKQEWGVTIPPPTAESPILAHELAQTGSGQWVTLYEYDKIPFMTNTEMEEVTTENQAYYQKLLNKFKEDAIDTGLKSDMKKSLQDHEPTIEVGDYAYYRAKNDGKDYFLAIQEKKQLYTYTWHE